ncbi:MAG: hypothetical protein K0041_08645, partial [Acidithiobacillus sp.]|nr:hypothetical protein [Acidithiobacillus sp.]
SYTKHKGIDVVAAESAIRSALSAMRQNERPGVRRSGGTKMDALNAAKDEIIQALKDGYSSAQIAEYIRNSDAGFGVLPKTITLIGREAKEAEQQQNMPRAPRRKSVKAAEKVEQTGNEQSHESAVPEPAEPAPVQPEQPAPVQENRSPWLA